MKEFVLLDSSLLLRKSDILYVEIIKEDSIMKVVNKYGHEYNINVVPTKFDDLVKQFIIECNTTIKLVDIKYSNIFLNIDNVSSIETQRCIFNSIEFYLLDVRWISNYQSSKSFRLDKCNKTDLFELLGIIKDWGV